MNQAAHPAVVMITWPPIHRCRVCHGPLHKTLWTAGQHPNCGAPLVIEREQEHQDHEHEHQEQEPVPVPDDKPRLVDTHPLYWPVHEISEARQRNRWDD